MPAAPDKHVILFMAANPQATDRLALDEEAHAIQVELERSGYRERFEFVTRWASQPLDLLREARKLKPTILHFSGHGDAADGLHFHSAGGAKQAVSPKALASTIASLSSSIRVVVLNACYSEPVADALVNHVDCVVGMAGTIDDRAARYFSIGFYGGVAECEAIAAAVEQGNAAISIMGLQDDVIPQLKVRAGCDAGKLVLASDAERPSSAANGNGGASGNRSVNIGRDAANNVIILGDRNKLS